MIGIVDMGLGNLRSVRNAFAAVGANTRIVAAAQDLQECSAMVLPGVGAFADGMEGLRSRGLVHGLMEAVNRGVPLLGICLGMQLLAEAGEEHGNHEGLGLIQGRIRKIPASAGLRVPNMGWCDVRVDARASLLPPGSTSQSYYFAHSYYLADASPDVVVAVLELDVPICVAIEKDNVFGVQFHPEKSQGTGLAFIDAFVQRAAQSATRIV